MTQYHSVGYKELLIIITLLVLFPIALILPLIINETGGFFTYSLDDPYIHLALAKNIWLGNYGINLSEPSAPSSSILWPFLLAPFSFFSVFFEFVPLIINVCCLGLLVFAIDKAFSDLKLTSRLTLIAVILISLNAYGLVFTGMEHSLQILLVAVILLPILENIGKVKSTYSTPGYAICALILLPLIRYEGLAISLPVLFYIYSKGEIGKAVFALSVITIVMAGFSIFLDSLNLGWLPSSIVAKSSHSDGLHSTIENLIQNILKYGFLFLPISILVVYFWNKDKSLSLVLLTSTVLHFLLGKYGWFGRYENYYLLFIILICLRLIINLDLRVFPAIFCLPLMFFSLSPQILRTPLASSNIQNQQAQMANIAKMLAEPVAVNDLGLMALKSGQYVLDLWGLGSIDALRYRKTRSDIDWMNELMEAKHVKYAFIYDTWFPFKPNNWIKVGELKLLQKRITAVDDTVALYAIGAPSAEKLLIVLKEFSKQQNSSTHFSIQTKY